jgi:KipI family sensor histidine kinase inhibitor
MDIKQISPNSLLISFDNIISQDISYKVQTAYQHIKNLQDSNIWELIPSYTTIYISFDISKYSFLTLNKILTKTLSQKNRQDEKICEIVNIDVYYGLEVGLDLEKISEETKLSIDDIIKIHSQKVYDVYAIGFLAGFGFLGKVDDKIATPRLTTPRKKVLQGSVAIANTQTAVYPKDSAGGWNIIGATCAKLFDKDLNELSLLSVGKKVKFNPISKQTYLNQGGIL